MPTFIYTALNKEGKKESSTIEAESLFSAGHLLKEQGLLPLDLKERKTHSYAGFMNSFGSVSLKEKIVFIEDLQVMLKAGITAPRALKIIAKQTKHKKFQIILYGLSEAVEEGKPIHEAMSAHGKVFSNIFISMIKVGEISGNLEKSLEYLGIQLEREADLKSKTKGAMIYPAVIVSAMVIIGILMAIFVLPKLTATFKDFGTKLPLTTRMVVYVSDFMAGHAIIVLVGLAGLVVGVIAFLRTPPGKQTLDWVLLHMPIISPIVKKINMARFCRILSSMLKAGIPIIEGLQVSAGAITNVYYKEVILQTAEEVRLGKPLTQTLGKHEQLFSSIVIQMLEVGEETGTLDNILEQLAQHFEAEVDNTMKNLSSIIEPILLLIIGAVVGFLALALISPIYNIGQNIQ